MQASVRAKKSLGQHWLVDGKVLSRIVRAAHLAEDETVIEIGPGKGALTRQLARVASRLIAVEIDSELAMRLSSIYADDPHISVLNEDVLEVPAESLLNAGGGALPYVVMGNLPYYIGTAIVRRFLTSGIPPRRMLVMLQAEVAERMAATPGAMSYLAVETQLFAEARVLFRIPPAAFRPPPKVQSALLQLDVRDSPDVEVDDLGAFLELVRAGFAAPRKRLRNSLAVGLRITAASAAEILDSAGVDQGKRPQELNLDEWRDVYFAWRRVGSPQGE
jgi:16S rRNA (adenine1518-N6/adenine1519-N6)-dimethyltransferase